MKKTTITVPTHLIVDGKRIALSMNQYRNLHYFTLNKLKKDFKQQISSQIDGKKFDRFCVEYFLYYKDNRRHDKMNFASVVSKFFLDALVECGCIPDDNDNYVGRESVEAMGIDKENPRCEIVITEL